MASPECERAIEDAVRYGNALLKFISPNDVGLTGGHQWGYYIPKRDDVWPYFTPRPPTKGENYTQPIRITWQNGRVTTSSTKWYGKGTRSEYRITGFGKDFPYISHLVVGELLVLVAVEKHTEFLGYVLDNEDDIEEITAQLGVSPAKNWAFYEAGVEKVETENECVEREFRDFAKELEDFPTGDEFSEATWRILEECLKNFNAEVPDQALMRCMDTEFNLFKYVERKLCESDLIRGFKDVDDFIATAQTLLQRRKSRAGRSLENHVEHYLRAAGIPHNMRPRIAGKPDVVIPGEKEYNDQAFDDDKLFLVGIKTTCKDRWPQVLKEGKRVKQKHLLTFQKGMAISQLQEMQESNVQLIVPKPLHGVYPPYKKSNVKILTLAEFIGTVKKRLN
jgi:hypothetical protein